MAIRCNNCGIAVVQCERVSFKAFGRLLELASDELLDHASEKHSALDNNRSTIEGGYTVTFKNVLEYPKR